MEKVTYVIVKKQDNNGLEYIEGIKKVVSWVGTVEYFNGSLPYTPENLEILKKDNPGAKLRGF